MKTLPSSSANKKTSSANKTARLKTASSASSRTKSSDAVTITHPERVVFAEGYTKQDVVDYYRAVMPGLLDAIRNRPLSIIRCPDGTAAGCFFQKHTLPGLKRVRSVVLTEESGGEGTYLYVDAPEQVIELVQFNAIEFHPWASTVQKSERTDYIVFDLDPGPDVVWKSVVSAAEFLRDRLSQIGLQSFVRTSGGKGLHVVVPLRPAISWSASKAFAHTFAQGIVDVAPDRFIATASKAKRGGVIFIDYLRNSRGATSVASYSLRARAGAPVAMPLRWDDLRKLKSASEFNLQNVPARLKRQRQDPWAGFGELRQSLPRVSAIKNMK
ncbi:MAG: non-homologous end-joining DNA ligase [Rudaea sp.]